MCAGVGSGGTCRKVAESSGVCYCRFRRQGVFSPDISSGVFRCGWQEQVLEAGRKVPESSGVC